MFTIEQIKTAHSKVRSGADFPAFIAEIQKMGVVRYTTFVSDGHTDYYGTHHMASSAPTYASMTIAKECNAVQFQKDLLAHQQGKTDYLTFCAQCAQLGIEKWKVSMEKMSCTYYDKKGMEILKEIIPG
ncbi:MAG: DUF1398 family protein [Sediminicola sp.]|tara:strand:+ start:102624 stop:103010 length:387 start_codon:yes stop_codon:yes gene_type:complete